MNSRLPCKARKKISLQLSSLLALHRRAKETGGYLPIWASKAAYSTFYLGPCDCRTMFTWINKKEANKLREAKSSLRSSLLESGAKQVGVPYYRWIYSSSVISAACNNNNKYQNDNFHLRNNMNSRLPCKANTFSYKKLRRLHNNPKGDVWIQRTIRFPLPSPITTRAAGANSNCNATTSRDRHPACLSGRAFKPSLF